MKKTYTITVADETFAVDSTKVVQDGNATIAPNTFNIWPTAVSALTITKGTEKPNVVNMYAVRFTAAIDNCPIVFEGFALDWCGSEPCFMAGVTYEVNIIDNIAIWAEITLTAL